jgi:uncharacterized protein
MKTLIDWERQLELKIAEIATAEDPAHDLLHFQRVVSTAKKICQLEKGLLEVVVPAAWLHDMVIVPKSDPRRSQASRLSAKSAVEYLTSIGYPAEFYEAIAHAIEAHSFSANIPARSLEAKIVQDADRLDGLGAIGVARCFATAGVLKRPFYSSEDPFCTQRSPNDQAYTLDHFYQKLFKVAETLHTDSGKAEGAKRVQSMRIFLNDLARESLSIG